MKFSYQWIREMVPELETRPIDLERLITIKTAECEGIEEYGTSWNNVVAVRVTGVEALPESKNKRVSISTGSGVDRVVVCGAPNVREGMIAAWVPPGTLLAGKEVRRISIDGVESDGLLASAAELGISRDHSGLLELTVEPGSPLPLLAPDWIIEIDNKSLTHRPDLWGHYGMAREVAAIAGAALKDPVKIDRLPSSGPAIDVHIDDYQLAPRYSALVLENITVEPSPLWLQARLEAVGLNAINNVVDVTNYVLAELPQPMHAFDADKLSGDAIFVRRARSGESFRALNDETYSLTGDDLVIADAAGPIALAGVIGGADSAISATTTRIVLESANFHPTTVRLSSARHKLRTDASMRFEKSLDPENTVRALARAVELLASVSPGMRLSGGLSDNRGPHTPPPPIRLPLDFVTRKLGVEVSETRVRSILESLGFGVQAIATGVFEVTVPSWRSTKDVSIKDDLVEEIGRMVGYGEIEARAPLTPSVVPASNPFRIYLRKVRAQLAAQGLTEVYNYSFVNVEAMKRFDLTPETHLALLNPIASELTHMRRSLLPNIFQNILNNARHLREFRFFEIGREIHPVPGKALPHESTHVVGVIFAVHADEQEFFEWKRVVECLLPGAQLRAAESKIYEHPTRTAEILWRDAVVGRLFELHPSLLQEAGLEGRADVFDIDLDAAFSRPEPATVYQPPRRYPTSGFDLSVITGVKEPVSHLQDSLVQLAGPALVSIEFVRQYAGQPLEEGQKSVSYHLEVGAADHTLTNEEVTEVRERIIEGMRTRGYDLRV